MTPVCDEKWQGGASSLSPGNSKYVTVHKYKRSVVISKVTVKANTKSV